MEFMRTILQLFRSCVVWIMCHIREISRIQLDCKMNEADDSNIKSSNLCTFYGVQVGQIILL